MFLRLLRINEMLPAGASGMLGIFRVIPAEGRMHEMIAPTAGTSQFRGRFVGKGAGVTDLTCSIDFKADFANTAQTITTVTGTTLTTNNTFMLPYFRLLLNGTAGSNDTHAELMVALGFPVRAVTCVAALAGMPWQAGQNLADVNAGFLAG